MGGSLAHRGPDAEDIFEDADAGLGLVHRRLSILDLSPAGAQPMTSPGGRWVIAYNGEIYNHPELRRELEEAGRAPAWRGHSDTETLLALVETHGVEGALSRIRGMFAFALWDRSERRLTLARDRMGEKPLYYGRVGRTFVFASELFAFHAMPGFSPELDREAIQNLLRYQCVPAPASIYAGISKLRPGCVLELDAGDRQPVERPYWRLVDTIAGTASARRAERPYAELVDETEAVLARAVREQMLSDVPLGAFLSGGLDSSLIAALMVSAGAGEVRTYSIGFEVERFNEAEAARAVARHLGTAHTEFLLTEADALSVVGEIGGLFSEPFADSSQIPTVVLSRLTRSDVTVALSGDGGDEMFGGYNRHFLAPRIWAQARRVPPPLRRAAAGLAAGSGRLLGERAIGRLAPLAARLGLPATTFDKLAHFAGAAADARDFEGFYAGLIGQGWQAGRLRRTPGGSAPPDGASVELPEGLSDAERVMAWDALWYLPEDILVKVDRSAMSTSLETRAPFLDLSVVEAAWSLPLSARIAGGKGKRITRDILYRHVPRELIERPKQGFTVPLGAWLRGPLRDWAGDRLREAASIEEAELDAAALETMWRRHQNGSVDAGSTLWPILMLADWHRRGREPALPRPVVATAAQ